jgi:cold-inducible RNA-binding protein
MLNNMQVFLVPGFVLRRSFACRFAGNRSSARLRLLDGGSFRRICTQEKTKMGRRLYVGNLSYGTTELELREVFGQYGTVADAKVVTERETGRPRGFAFVEMSTEQEAQTAAAELSGRELGGRAINVNEAQERSSGGGNRSSGGGGGRRW